MSECRAVVFDFFGVISSEVAPFWFEKYFPKEEARKYISEDTQLYELILHNVKKFNTKKRDLLLEQLLIAQWARKARKTEDFDAVEEKLKELDKKFEINYYNL